MVPTFNLMDQAGQIFSLVQQLLHGPVLLIFYPYDQSPNCTVQLCEANVELEAFSSHGVTIVGINNAAADSHLRFANKRFLKMRLLSDFDYEVARQFDCLFEIGPIKVIRRTVMAINADREVIYLQRGMPPIAEVLASVVSNARK